MSEEAEEALNRGVLGNEFDVEREARVLDQIENELAIGIIHLDLGLVLFFGDVFEGDIRDLLEDLEEEAFFHSGFAF